MHLVDVIKNKETGVKYTIPHGDPLPSDMYERIARNLSPDEARAQYNIGIRLNPKQKC